MSEPSPVAGPSKPRFFFPPPFRISESRPPSTTSRSSTPLYLVPQRFRSVSVVSSRADEELRKKRTESVKRLRTTWELINEKYGSVLPEEDDEIDLRRGKVVKDRGWLRRQERREFGEISDRDEESSVLGGPETVSFDSDEDELGAWDERSGLDIQVPELEEEPSPPRRTQEDEDDLKAFLRAEVERKLALGDVPEEERSENSSSEDEGTGWTTSSWGGREDSLDALSPRLRRTRISVGLEDLFPADEDRMEEGSEDELLRHDSDAEQAIQVVAATINHEEVRLASSSCGL